MSKKTKKNNNLTFDHPDTRNAFNTLVANIKFASIDEHVKTITVTAAGEDEGKTTVAANLALSLANTGKKVLLVDTDLRRRSLGSAINVHPKYGIYSALSGHCSVNEAISQTHNKSLFFLDCEPNIPDPAVVLSANTFAKFVDFLHDIFDYVIFDTPPLSTFVDAALVAAITDATLIAVRQNYTKKTDLANTITQLKAAEANIIGSVMTFSEDAYASQYYYAYYNVEGKRTKKKESSDIQKTPDSQVKANLASWMDVKTQGNAQKRQHRMATDQANQKQNDDIANTEGGKPRSHIKPGTNQDTQSFKTNTNKYGKQTNSDPAKTNVMKPVK